MPDIVHDAVCVFCMCVNEERERRYGEKGKRVQGSSTRTYNFRSTREDLRNGN